jgi:hypothetical protein
MIIHASAKFSDRLNCMISLPGRRRPQTGNIDCWSADIVRAYGVGDCALAMNDASLSIVVVPLKGVRTFEQFLPAFLERAARLFKAAGGFLETRNQTVIVLRRTDQQLIGTMNDAQRNARYEIEYRRAQDAGVDWDAVEDELNQIPFSAIDYILPNDELARVLASPFH